jgi:hypothetical protein
VTVPVLTGVPVREGWDFGDFPYGLEPLTIPDAGTEPDGDGPCSRFAGLCTHLEHIFHSGVPGSVEPVESSDRLYWFRWITGHQVTFVLWQLVARELAMAERGERDREAALAAAALFTRGFSAMLLYTSSTPIDVYHEVIRPSMFLQHRGFSGTWAPDFAPVRDLYRGKGLPDDDSPGVKVLRDEVGFYQRVHGGIAAKLVPSGRSLLQDAAGAAEAPHPDVLSVVYDNYFMTLRAPTSLPDVVAQLLRRLNAVALDASENGVDSVSDAEDPPDELTSPEVRSCEAGFVGLLADVAACAAGSPAD